MNVEFFLHGVTKGQTFWGEAKEDLAYFGNLYNNSIDEVKFFIQLRSSNGKMFCYYNYLVYKNVCDIDGRSGSYFGITLRFPAYCEDIINIYRILDTVYNTYVIGTLLECKGSNINYLFPDFTSASKAIETIRDCTYQLIQKTFTDSSFISLDNSFAITERAIQNFYLYDCTKEKVLAIVKRYGQIAISPYYPSEKEKIMQQNNNAALSTIKQQYEERLKTASDTHAREKKDLNNKINQLQQDITKKNNIINDLNVNVSQLKKDLHAAGQSKKISEIVSTIKEPIIQLADHFHQLNQGYNTTSSIKTLLDKILPFINFLLLLLIVFVLLLINPFNRKTASDSEENKSEKIESIMKGIENLQKQLTTYQSRIGDVHENQNVIIGVKSPNVESVKKREKNEAEASNRASNGSRERKGAK